MSKLREMFGMIADGVLMSLVAFPFAIAMLAIAYGLSLLILRFLGWTIEVRT